MHFATFMEYTQCYGCLIELCSRGLRQGIHAPECKHLSFVSESNKQRAEARYLLAEQTMCKQSMVGTADRGRITIGSLDATAA